MSWLIDFNSSLNILYPKTVYSKYYVPHDYSVCKAVRRTYFTYMVRLPFTPTLNPAMEQTSLAPGPPSVVEGLLCQIM